jgi:uncharacterized protein (TIGR02996 family)
MTELDAMLAGIVAEPHEETRWLVLADWLEENDADPRRGELLRLHRKLLGTCCKPDTHQKRKVWQARIVELIAAGVRPCVPQQKVELSGRASMGFSFVPPGSFLMGGSVLDAEKPIHKVTLTKGFFLGACPVTQKQWQAVMGNAPSHFKGPNRPVEQVSWSDCQKFCKKLNAKLKGGRVGLPTEAEWEWACRAGTTSEYHFGDVLNTDLANYDGKFSWNDSPNGKSRKKTTDVASFPPNPWGLHDLHGNVWEWCSDQHTDYPTGKQTDPQGRSIRRDRVARGGSWNDNPVFCRSAIRGWNVPATRDDGLGFRVCFRTD